MDFVSIKIETGGFLLFFSFIYLFWGMCAVIQLKLISCCSGRSWLQGVKLSYQSYKILYFWDCPIKSYIFSKCPINPILSTKTAIFVSFKHFQGLVNKK